MILKLSTEKETQRVSAQLAHVLEKQKALTIFLQGGLGVGKTTFVRGFIHSLDATQKVKSPTFTLVESYTLQGFLIHHFDFYRIDNPNELAIIDVNDYFTSPAICFVEWPEKCQDFLPPPDLKCLFSFCNEGRKLELIADTSLGKRLLQRLSFL